MIQPMDNKMLEDLTLEYKRMRVKSLVREVFECQLFCKLLLENEQKELEL